MPPIVTALHYYPIKSCGGVTLEVGEADWRGFRYDRHWLIVDPHGDFVTQRELPRLALIHPTIHSGMLTINAPAMSPLSLPLGMDGRRMSVTVWDSECEAFDQGDDAAQWLSDTLESPLRLVRMADDHIRQVDQRYAKRTSDQVGFADGYPFLLISEESLADLNTRLDTPLPMNRFRPNLVVRGVDAYAEDGWKQIRIGAMIFDVVKACARCTITTTDQETAKRGKEPLRTLATYRDSERGVLFGQNLIHAAPGTVRVGDEVIILA
ncbi:MAG TPA: MOSC domain-containing protein [Aggregatilineales bacterium]|nr:MOSC domain-containing protein [Anaerolineales bacterium]HRE48062.1 MOSC domain-containing protein [Aggregatilineales bacterium]